MPHAHHDNGRSAERPGPSPVCICCGDEAVRGLRVCEACWLYVATAAIARRMLDLDAGRQERAA